MEQPDNAGSKQPIDYLQYCYIANKQFKQLLDIGFQWRQLKQLSLLPVENLIDFQGYRYLLDIRNCGIRQESQGKQGKLGKLSKLQIGSLIQKQVKIGNDTLKEIIHAFGNKLQQLFVSKCQITGSGLYPILNNPALLQNITYLNLNLNKLGSLGCKILSKAYFPFLINFSARFCQFGDHGAQHLSKARWKNLQSIDLTSNHIGVTAIVGSQSYGIFNWNWGIQIKQQGQKIVYYGCQQIDASICMNLQDAIGFLWLLPMVKMGMGIKKRKQKEAKIKYVGRQSWVWQKQFQSIRSS